MGGSVMAVVINGTTGIDKVQDGSIGTADIAADAITTTKIAADAITTAKIAAALDLSATTLTMPAGAILQAVATSGTSQITFSQDFSAYSTVVSGTITPSSTSSRILIMCQNALDACSGGSYPALHGHIARGGTELDGMELVLYQGATQSHRIAVISQNYIDSPNTTSAVTYNSNWANSTGSTQSGTYSGVANQYDSSRMFLLEIAG
jgi:hypothetical protein